VSVETLMPKLLKLSVAERLDLIDRLSESLPEEVAPSEVPDWHIEILKKRLAEAEANPGEGVPLSEFLKELRKSP
jgi:putative addiction module component (TIGR02574 family)